MQLEHTQGEFLYSWWSGNEGFSTNQGRDQKTLLGGVERSASEAKPAPGSDGFPRAWQQSAPGHLRGQVRAGGKSSELSDTERNARSSAQQGPSSRAAVALHPAKGTRVKWLVLQSLRDVRQRVGTRSAFQKGAVWETAAPNLIAVVSANRSVHKWKVCSLSPLSNGGFCRALTLCI